MKTFLKKLLLSIISFCLASCAILNFALHIFGTLKISEAQKQAVASEFIFEKPTSTALRVMSFNLLADYKGFGGGEVSPRAALFKKLVTLTRPDVLCLQEESFSWFCALEKNFKEYRQTRPLSSFLGLKMTAVMYNKSTVKLLKSGELEYKNGDDFRTRRASYAIFSQKSTSKKFAVISTHLSFLRKTYESLDIITARLQCAELLGLITELKEKYGCAVIVAGDFNSKESSKKSQAEPTSEVYEILKSVLIDAKPSAKELFAEESEKEAPSYDHIFISGNADITGFSVISSEPYSGISDHLPIFSDIILKEY